MKKLSYWLLMLTASFTLTSCAILGSGNTVKYLSRIHPGQTHREVRDIMRSEPAYIRFNETGWEQWEFKRNEHLSGDYDAIIISFRDGKVVSMDSYRYVYPKTPDIKVEHTEK